MIDDARKMKKPCRYCGSMVRWEGFGGRHEGCIYGLYVYRGGGESRLPAAHAEAAWMSKFCTHSCANLYFEEGGR